MKILIVKTSSLGDIIHTFAAIQYLHDKIPQVQIDWVVEAPFSEVVKSHPFVRKVYEIETKNWRKARNVKKFFNFFSELRSENYDVLFDFQANLKSSLITAFAKSIVKVGFGKKSVSEWPSLLTTNYKADPPKSVNVRQENLFLAQSFFKDKEPYVEKKVLLTLHSKEQKLIDAILSKSPFAKRKRIMVCPGAAWQNKQLSEESLSRFLKKIGGLTPSSFLIIWGSGPEKALAYRIKDNLGADAAVLDKMAIPTLQNLMDHMDLVIGMDSLPLHLAGTTSAQTYGIFGPSSAEKFKPEGPGRFAFQGKCPYGKEFYRRCPILRTCKTGACIRNACAEELFLDFKSKRF